MKFCVHCGQPRVGAARFCGSCGAEFATSPADRQPDTRPCPPNPGRRSSAVVRFVQYLADFTETFQTVRWLMGSLDVAAYAPIGAALVPMTAAFAGFVTLPRALDLISVGSESAAARGVNVTQSERVALVSASLATGAAVSLAGPVSFVGIVVPHLVRLIVGADHRLVLPASALFGAAFLIGCDLIARTALAPVELPVGIVTAIIGGPFFLWLLFRRG